MDDQRNSKFVDVVNCTRPRGHDFDYSTQIGLRMILDRHLYEHIAMRKSVERTTGRGNFSVIDKAISREM